MENNNISDSNQTESVNNSIVFGRKKKLTEKFPNYSDNYDELINKLENLQTPSKINKLLNVFGDKTNNKKTIDKILENALRKSNKKLRSSCQDSCSLRIQNS